YLTTRDGRPTNAVYGFTTMLLKVLEEERPTHLAAAFDRPAPTFRHATYRPYKATRPQMPDDLRVQIRSVRRVCEAFRVPVFEVEGYEADDVIATLAHHAEEVGFEVLVVTGDLDLLQVATDRTKVMVTSRGLTETTVYDAARVRERFGVQPAQLADLRALCGDPSDNLPGVPGVGEVTAARLLQRFGGVEELLEQLDHLPPTLRARLGRAREQILHSRQLALLVRDVPLRLDWEDLRVRPYDPQEVAGVFSELEFKSLLERLGLAPVHHPAGRYTRAPDWVPRPAEWVAVALDGTGKPMEGTVVGVAFSAQTGEATYVPVGETAPAGVAAVLEGEVRKISADVKSDLVRLRRMGLRPQGFAFDTGLASYVLNPGRRAHDLRTVAWEQIRWRLAGNGAAELPLEERWRRVCEEADVLQRLLPPLLQAMREREVERVYWEIELPLVEVLAEMELAGVAVDVPYLQALGREFRARLRDLAEEIYALAGTEFNLSSPKQLGFVLFEKLGLPRLKRTKTGYSTDAEVLEALAPHHEVVAKILEYRELHKLLSTYVEVLPKLVNPHTGRVHTTFNQTGTATGRLSSQDPNLQNIPVRTEEGRKIRRAFIAEPGKVLLSADYNQIELRILAHVSGDAALQEVFRAGRDIHAEVGSEVFGLPPDRLTPEHRRVAKVINYGIVYGISPYGLAQRIGCTAEEAERYIQRYFDTFPGVKAYLERTVAEARRKGYVTTLLGRRRYLPDLHSRNRSVREAAERAAWNTPIQGSQADLIKLAMIRIHREVLPRFPNGRMLLQVHDELVFETPKDQVQELGRAVREAMRDAMALDVPVEVEVKAGPNWRDLDPL
ncbi:MAG: DNA polymerase I, partial [Armatimonadota bacterium]|nr:DNA polymerase I [Armatimonadota bacterium]